MTKRTRLFALVVACLMTSSLCICPNQCARCNGSFCTICWKRALSLAGKCSDTPPESKNCNIFIAGQNERCFVCAPGTALDLQTYKCITPKNVIQNCVQQNQLNGIDTCLICRNNSGPSKDLRSCIPLENPLPNCRSTILTSASNGSYGCARCEEGYVSSGINMKCFPQIVKGCLYSATDRTKCTILITLIIISL